MSVFDYRGVSQRHRYGRSLGSSQGNPLQDLARSLSYLLGRALLTSLHERPYSLLRDCKLLCDLGLKLSGHLLEAGLQVEAWCLRCHWSPTDCSNHIVQLAS